MKSRQKQPTQRPTQTVLRQLPPWVGASWAVLQAPWRLQTTQSSPFPSHLQHSQLLQEDNAHGRSSMMLLSFAISTCLAHSTLPLHWPRWFNFFLQVFVVKQKFQNKIRNRMFICVPVPLAPMKELPRENKKTCKKHGIVAFSRWFWLMLRSWIVWTGLGTAISVLFPKSAFWYREQCIGTYRNVQEHPLFTVLN